MTLSVDAIEAIWITLNLTTFVLTASALLDAMADRAAVRLLNGRARELAAAGIVRREVLRLAVQALFLIAIVPGLFVERPVSLTPTVLALMSVPAILLVSSVLDARDRKAMTVIVASDALSYRADALQRIESELKKNTAISVKASEHADAAYHEANSVNLKIASQGDAMVAQGERAESIAETVDDTHERVIDIQERT